MCNSVDSHYINDYQSESLSVLPVLSKVNEKRVKSQLYSFIEVYIVF